MDLSPFGRGLDQLEARKSLWPPFAQAPELELPQGAVGRTLAELADRIFDALMTDPSEPMYLAKPVLPRGLVEVRAPGIHWDRSELTVLRSCLMKPEHQHVVPWLHDRLERELR